MERVWRTASGALAGAPAAQLAAVGPKAVPPRRPRVLALDLEDRGGRAAALHERLVAALVAAGLHRAEQRPLWPHVTVARMSGRARPPAFAAPPLPGPFTATRVTLYRSDLHPGGARYAPLERIELG